MKKDLETGLDLELEKKKKKKKKSGLDLLDRRMPRVRCWRL